MGATLQNKKQEIFPVVHLSVNKYGQNWSFDTKKTGHWQKFPYSQELSKSIFTWLQEFLYGI